MPQRCSIYSRENDRRRCGRSLSLTCLGLMGSPTAAISGAWRLSCESLNAPASCVSIRRRTLLLPSRFGSRKAHTIRPLRRGYRRPHTFPPACVRIGVTWIALALCPSLCLIGWTQHFAACASRTALRHCKSLRASSPMEHENRGRCQPGGGRH
ncbi:hypothetical protein D3C71_1084680 [compost metagenome]